MTIDEFECWIFKIDWRNWTLHLNAVSFSGRNWIENWWNRMKRWRKWAGKPIYLISLAYAGFFPKKGGGGGTPTLFPSSKILGQFSRHGVGISSYITNISDKARKQANKRKEKGGVSPPPPPPCVRACLIRIYIDFIMVSCTSWLMPKAGKFHYILIVMVTISLTKKNKHHIFMTSFFFLFDWCCWRVKLSWYSKFAEI